MAPDVGVPLQKGSRVIMQVHYNLLAGPRPDVSATQLRLAPGVGGPRPARDDAAAGAGRAALPPGHTQSLLCDRATAVADVQKRFGDEVGQTANYLHLLCGQVQAGPVQTCDRQVSEPATIRAVAGHMHLLGRSIRIEVDPGTPRARTVLDMPVWDFDNQGAKAVKPVALQPGDTRPGHLPARPAAARPAAGVQGPARALRRVGRGHDRRDVPRDPARHAPLTAVPVESAPTTVTKRDPGVTEKHPMSERTPGAGGRRAGQLIWTQSWKASQAVIDSSITQATTLCESLRESRDEATAIIPALSLHRSMPIRCASGGNGLRGQEVLGLDELHPVVVGVLRLVVLLHAGTVAPTRSGPAGNALAQDRGRSRKLDQTARGGHIEHRAGGRPQRRP